MSKRRSTALLTAGVVFIGLAAAGHFVATPALSKLPSDTDMSAEYSGTAYALDPATMKLGAGVPITADRRVQVTNSSGDVAVIRSSAVVHTPAGEMADEHSFAINRSDYSQAAAPAGVSVEDQLGGMTISRPMDPTTSAFTVYDTTTQSAVPVEFTGTETLNGRTVHEFSGAETAPVRNEALLVMLRAGIAAVAQTGDGTALPKGMLEGVAAQLGGAEADMYTTLLAQLPDEVPVVFTATVHNDIAIDSEMGAPVRTAQAQTVTANIQAGSQLVPMMDLSRTELASTPQSIASAAVSLDDASGTLALIDTWIPLALAFVGAVLIGLSGIRRRSAHTDQSLPSAAHEPAGV